MFKANSVVFILFILTVLLFSSARIVAAAVFGFPHTLSEACEELADDLGNSGRLDNKRVAVLEFEPRGKAGPSMLDRRISEYLSMALADVGDRSWTVVERLELARMENEIHEHKSMAFDYNDWMRNKLDADLCIMGGYLFVGDSLRITAKVVDSVSGSTVTSATVDQLVDDEVRQMSRTMKPVTDFARIAENIQAVLTGGSSSEKSDHISRTSLFKMKDGRRVAFKDNASPVFVIGDKMGFSIKPPMASKLYVFNYDPAAEQGEAILLYPIPGMRSTLFSAGSTSSFPACISQGVDSYEVTEPRGRMIFKIIGVDAGVNADLTRSLKQRDGYYWLDSGNLKAFINDLSALPKSSWWAEDVEFWIQ